MKLDQLNLLMHVFVTISHIPLFSTTTTTTLQQQQQNYKTKQNKTRDKNQKIRNVGLPWKISESSGNVWIFWKIFTDLVLTVWPDLHLNWKHKPVVLKSSAHTWINWEKVSREIIAKCLPSPYAFPARLGLDNTAPLGKAPRNTRKTRIPLLGRAIRNRHVSKHGGSIALHWKVWDNTGTWVCKIWNSRISFTHLREGNEPNCSANLHSKN